MFVFRFLCGKLNVHLPWISCCGSTWSMRNLRVQKEVERFFKARVYFVPYTALHLQYHCQYQDLHSLFLQTLALSYQPLGHVPIKYVQLFCLSLTISSQFHQNKIEWNL